MQHLLSGQHAYTVAAGNGDAQHTTAATAWAAAAAAATTKYFRKDKKSASLWVLSLQGTLTQQADVCV